MADRKVAMTVRTENRRGTRHWIIDIRYTKRDGTRGRYRHDAEVQTAAAARAEDRRRLGMLANTGLPFDPVALTAAPDDATTLVAKPTFAEVVKTYLSAFAPSHLKPSTVHGYRKVLDGILVPKIGKLTIDAIDASVVRAIDGEMVRRGAGRSTRRNVQAVLRSVLRRYAVEAGLLDVAPTLPALPRVGGTVSSTLTIADVAALLAVAPEHERIAFMLAAYAGLRAGEVRGLRWRDVNLTAGQLVVRRSVCHGVAASPKSGHQRLVPLPEPLRGLLDAQREHGLDAPVSIGADGPWTQWGLLSAFRSACRRTGMKGWRFHDLRHFYVTSLFRARVPAPTVQRLAGHEHLATTQRYAHLAGVDLATAVGDFDRLLRGNSGATDPSQHPRP